MCEEARGMMRNLNHWEVGHVPLCKCSDQYLQIRGRQSQRSRHQSNPSINTDTALSACSDHEFPKSLVSFYDQTHGKRPEAQLIIRIRISCRHDSHLRRDVEIGQWVPEIDYNIFISSDHD